LERGHFVSEAAMWVNNWNNCGQLAAAGRVGGTFLRLDATKLTEIMASHPGILDYAMQYAKCAVRVLNNIESRRLTDLTSFYQYFDTGRNAGPENDTDMRHFIFISHVKVEAGTEAALMQEALVQTARQDIHNDVSDFAVPIFLDTENLSDLGSLARHVESSENLILLLTDQVLQRPWVLFEIVIAMRAGVRVVPVAIQRPGVRFDYPDEVYYKKFRDGKVLSEAALKVLHDAGIDRRQELEDAIRQVFRRIALPFSPHKSGNVRNAELADIYARCHDPGNICAANARTSLVAVPGRQRASTFGGMGSMPFNIGSLKDADCRRGNSDPNVRDTTTDACDSMEMRDILPVTASM